MLETLGIIISSGVWTVVMAILLAWFQRRWGRRESGRLDALEESQRALLAELRRLEQERDR